MTDDRYEIRGKIGQGGVGAVYRAWDKRLNRDVAIKRVLAGGGYESQDEAVEYLLKEATSLSSVQHPHIVTVFDAGVDDEGPYVVMELLAGRTIDEMIERGSLVMEDFREVAVQSQEALIAAQDLNLVHRDLKPTNVMVTWLPSGKFQVKLVDFGLAKFHPKPSVQTIDHGDAVFGSIHFMAPEQFERTPLDQRTDMYAIGCLYYFCLTGLYPFNGETAPEVMAAHLQHLVTPLTELRPDLPAWVCEWVMWHIERSMADRPASARDALQHFFQMEKGDQAAPATSTTPQFVFSDGQQIRTPQPATPPTTAVVPLASATPTTGVVMTKTAPQPIEPPEGRKPSIHTTSQVTMSTPPSDPESGTPSAHPAVPSTEQASPTATIKPTPVAGTKISLKNPTAQPLAAKPAATPPPAPPATPPPAPRAAPPAAPATVPLPGGTSLPTPVATAVAAVPVADGPSTVITGSTEVAHKPGLSTGAKIAIGAILTVLIIFVGFLVSTKLSSNSENKHITELVAKIADPEARDVPLSKDDASLLLGRVSSTGVDDERLAIYQLLSRSKGTDGNDLDAQIASYAADSNRRMADELRLKLFQVLRSRKGPSSVSYLIEFAKSSNTPSTATAALAAAETLATESNVSDLLGIVQFSEHHSVRNAAESALASLAERSSSKGFLADAIFNVYDSAPSEEIRHAYLRLLGAAGGARAKELVLQALNSKTRTEQLASIATIKNWANDSMFEELLLFASIANEPMVRSSAFNGAYDFLQLDRQRSAGDHQAMWTALTKEARSKNEKLKMINGLARLHEKWALPLVQSFLQDSDDDVILRAEKARDYIQDRQ